MAKYHVGRNGKPALCPAKKQCRLKDANGNTPPHYSSLEAATIASQSEGMKSALKSRSSARTSIKNDNIAYGDTPGVVQVYGKTYNEAHAKSLVDARKTLGKFIQVRAFAGDLSENINRTSAAVKRMNKLGDFAMARGDKHAMEKLEGAVLADKMHFRTEDGTVVHVNEALTASANYKAWDDGNKQATAELTKLAQDSSIEAGAYKFNGVTVKVTDGEVNRDYQKTLNEDTLRAISEVKSSPDINLAKSNLSPERLNQVLSFETVAEVMDGRMEESRSAGVSAYNPKVEGETAQEKFNSVGASYGEYVKTMQSTLGAKSAVKSTRDNVTKIVKAEANAMNEKMVAESTGNKYAWSMEEKTESGARNIVFGGRKLDTGILVSGRNKLSRDAKDILTKEEYEAICVQKPTISKEKAQEHLSPEQFNKLFSARKVSLQEARYSAPKK